MRLILEMSLEKSQRLVEVKVSLGNLCRHFPEMILTKLLLRIYLSMLQDGMTNPEHFIPRSEDCAAMSITFGMPHWIRQHANRL